jgi:hypothetical protein
MAEDRMARDRARQRGRRWHSGYEEVVVAAIFLAGMLFFRLRLENFVLGREGSFLGPAFWPGVLLTIGVVLSAAYLVLAVVWARRRDRELAHAHASTDDTRPAGRADPEPEVAAPGNVWKLVGGFVALGAYIYLLAPLGFVPSTALFSVAFLLLVGERRWYVLVAFPVVAVTILIGVFTQLLTVSLPRGTGFFIDLSTYLY